MTRKRNELAGSDLGLEGDGIQISRALQVAAQAGQALPAGCAAGGDGQAGWGKRLPARFRMGDLLAWN